jgi:hypothetical protein
MSEVYVEMFPTTRRGFCSNFTIDTSLPSQGLMMQEGKSDEDAISSPEVIESERESEQKVNRTR